MFNTSTNADNVTDKIMSDKKQSSVDWLVNHWKKLQSEDAKMSWNQIIEITELVKEMHEEEMKQAYFVWGTEMKILNNPTTKHLEVIMSNNKQDHIVDSNKMVSSVEWLVEQFEESYSYINEIFKETIEQAKAKHEQEIMKAVDRGFDEGCKFPEDITLSNSRQYYNETFGKDE